VPAKSFIISCLQENNWSVNPVESIFINFYIELISFGKNVLYNTIHSMRSRTFLEGRNINYALSELTVKVSRDHSDKIKVRACLPVIWVYWGQAKMKHFLPDPILFFLNQIRKANIK